MVFLMLTLSLLFTTLFSPLVEACNSSDLTAPPKPTLNPIDACWRTNPKWATNRQALALCAVGFGRTAYGGKSGPIYVVTTPEDNFRAAKPGTLRYGVSQKNPLWITFAKDMVIVLKDVLFVSSYKTIDGRGAKVEIANGPCIRLKQVSHVIIHGISIHDCKPGPREGNVNGDAIRVYGSTHVWIDHCLLSRSHDGLIDVVHASTAITISNNRLTHHKKAVLLGHTDNFVADKKMKVTVAFNYFGPGLNARMPRVRRGYAHVANNRYDHWITYAIGGSGDPIIFSEGNYFVASKSNKQVTKRMGNKSSKWKWSTTKDVFMNGAFFGPSSGGVPPMYTAPGEAFQVAHGSFVPSLTSSAGPLNCRAGNIC